MVLLPNAPEHDPILLPLAKAKRKFKLIQLLCFLEFLAEVADSSLSPRLLFLNLKLFFKNFDFFVVKIWIEKNYLRVEQSELGCDTVLNHDLTRPLPDDF